MYILCMNVSFIYMYAWGMRICLKRQRANSLNGRTKDGQTNYSVKQVLRWALSKFTDISDLRALVGNWCAYRSGLPFFVKDFFLESRDKEK